MSSHATPSYQDLRRALVSQLSPGGNDGAIRCRSYRATKWIRENPQATRDEIMQLFVHVLDWQVHFLRFHQFCDDFIRFKTLFEIIIEGHGLEFALSLSCTRATYERALEEGLYDVSYYLERLGYVPEIPSTGETIILSAGPSGC